MIIENTSEVNASVTFDGTVYSVDAGEVVEVSEAIGGRWMEVHEFLSVGAAKEVKAEKVEKKEEKKEDKK